MKKDPKSDRGKWFVSTDNSGTVIKCEEDTFLNVCIKLLGPIGGRKLFTSFRRATFEEYCSLELDLMESTNL